MQHLGLFLNDIVVSTLIRPTYGNESILLLIKATSELRMRE